VVCGVESSSLEGAASSEEDRSREDIPSQTSMDYEQFMGIVERIAAVWPGGYTVHMDPLGYTLEEHIRRYE
jgi:hypothetical protein